MGSCQCESSSKKAKFKELSHFQSQGFFEDSITWNIDPNHYIPLSNSTIKDDIEKYFRFSEKILKKGSYGLISEAIEHETGNRYAIKSISKSLYSENEINYLKCEIDIILCQRHEYIVKCFSIYEDIKYIHMVMEYSDNGDLLDYLINSHPQHISETKAAVFISQCLEALHYLHLNRIVHRDIKLENFLLFEEDFSIKLKLIDFGFASKLDNELTDKVGSIPYMAPEMFVSQIYDEKVDIWACGIMLYNILTGSQLFYADSQSELVLKIKNYKGVCLEGNIWNNISNNSKDLLMLLLEKDPDLRPSAFQARQHSWLKTVFTKDETVQNNFVPKPDIINEIIKSLVKYKDIKTELYELCVKYLEINEAHKIKRYLMTKSENSKDLISNNIVLFETFSKAIFQYCKNNELKISLKEIIKQKLCSESIINYSDFFNLYEKRELGIKRLQYSFDQNHIINEILANTQNIRATISQINKLDV